MLSVLPQPRAICSNSWGWCLPKVSPQRTALQQIGEDIEAFQPGCAIDAANLRILEKLYNTLAVMTGQSEREPRAL
jgi:hypothetical protein